MSKRRFYLWKQYEDYGMPYHVAINSLPRDSQLKELSNNLKNTAYSKASI